MKELWAVGLAELKDDTTAERYRQRITLEKEFEWLLSEDFKKICEGFKPVDYRPFLKDVDASKGNTLPKAIFSVEQITTFLRVFGELEDVSDS